MAGVPLPPTEEIAAQLDRAYAEWEPIRLVAATVASGGAVSAVQRVTLVWPPSRRMFWPTMKPANCEQRKAQAAPNSSAVP